MKQVKIKNLTIGDGSVKICVSIPGETQQQILDEIEYIKNKPFDMFEWRADLWANVSDKAKLADMMRKIKTALPDKPFLFTYRTKDEGGLGETDLRYYIRLCEYVADTKLPDIIDIEFTKMKSNGVSIIGHARNLGVKVLSSYHSFDLNTPDRSVMMEILREQQQAGSDITKLAVMASSSADSTNIISAAEEMHANHAKVPFVLIGMGEHGGATRLARPFHGSSITFARGRRPTAPGQLSVDEL